MVTAYPVDIKGERIGPLQSFSDHHWAEMLKIKKLRWVQSDAVPKKAIELIVPEKENKTESSEPSKHRGSRKSITNKKQNEK